MVTLGNPKRLTKNTGEVSIDDITIYEDIPNEISFFPNPVEGQITISYKPEREALWTLFNISGQVVYSKNLPIGETIHRYDLSQLDAGIYIMTIHSSGLELMRDKIIKL